MIPAMSNIALKEWDVTIEAISQGQQTILLRKGGLLEDSRPFVAEHDEFFLYPTFFHATSTLLKQGNEHLLDRPEVEDAEDIVTLSVLAEVHELIVLTNTQQLEALSEFHIWSQAFLDKRIKWRAQQPLTMVILRAHVLQQPQALMVVEEYGGCKSWVELIEDYPVGTTTPALSQRRFKEIVSNIKGALADEKSNSSAI